MKVIICGQLLREKRASMMEDVPRGTSSIHGRNQYNLDQGFRAWLAEKNIPKTTAYRYMDTTERVTLHVRKIPYGSKDETADVIDVGGHAVPLSIALTAPPEKLGQLELNFRQDVEKFMSDKSLNEAVSAASEGESPSSRVSRASVGKNMGGRGNVSRKDYALFIANTLRILTSHLSHYRNFDGKQIESTRNRFRENLDNWPTDCISVFVEEAKKALQKR